MSWPEAFCETEPYESPQKISTVDKLLRPSNAFCSMCRRGKIMNINKKKFAIQIIKASLIPLFVSGVGGKQAKNIFIFFYDIISTHFCAPNASKSGTSFKVSYNRTRNNELPWSGHSEFTIKLRGMGRRVCLQSKLENTCLSKRISPSCRPIRTMENMTSSL